MSVRRSVFRCVAVCAVMLLVSTHAVRRTSDADEDESAAHGVPPAMQATGDEDHSSGEASEPTDPEEFIAPPASKEDPPPKERKPTAQRKAGRGPPPPRDYRTEGLVAVVMVAYIINYVIGRGSNLTIANSWAKLVLDDSNVCSIAKNFALVHPDNSRTVQKCLMKDSASCFQIYSTGRRHCAYMMSTLDLNSRQDLFAVVYNQFFGQTSNVFDTVQVEVALDADLLSKYSLCVCTNPRRVKAEFRDLESLTVQAKTKLPRGLSMLTECDEISTEFVRACGPEVLKALDTLKDTIDYIHISDTSSTDPRHPYMLRCVFRMPSQKAFEASPDIVLNQVRLAVSLIDVVAQVANWCGKHGEVLTRVHNLRTERVQSKTERLEERAQKKRDEKLNKEKEKKAKMTDEQLAKYEEKEYRKALKKKNRVGGGKMKMMKI